jgi:hypothetical protein
MPKDLNKSSHYLENGKRGISKSYSDRDQDN